MTDETEETAGDPADDPTLLGERASRLQSPGGPPGDQKPDAGDVADDVPGDPTPLEIESADEPSAAVAKRPGLFTEIPPEPRAIPATTLKRQTRRDFLLFGAGTAATVAGFWWLLPDDTRKRMISPEHLSWLDSLEARAGATPARRERFLNRVLTFDDDVSEALYSPSRTVRTYNRADVTRPLRNNYAGRTPKGDYLPAWTLTLSGLQQGASARLTLDELLRRFAHREQITRLCCVEGWSAVAWWGGFRFADLLAAYPPAPGARWAAITSAVNLDGAGRPDPYYVSIDLDTARHPQALLATRNDGRPLTLAHGAPLRLVVPMKLGLKNIKAITSIEYVRDEPKDYWAERGYSRYDGL
jgi:DMSO/TMAO reductase YedYZ molybdopterin-dependent catalytic subunit